MRECKEILLEILLKEVFFFVKLSNIAVHLTSFHDKARTVFRSS